MQSGDSIRVCPSQSSLLKAALVCALLMLARILFAFGPAPAQKNLSAVEARDHIGEMATVCGTVTSARYAASSKGRPTFLNFDKPYPNQIFTVVIWGSNRGKFSAPETDYKGKRICVTGQIAEYRGLPEIVVDNPKQIKAE